MASRRELERRLEGLAGFADPQVVLEQYPTPPDIAAHLLHVADMHDDLDGLVVDLGTGTGVLALGAALRGADRVVGLELDRTALQHARVNETRLHRQQDEGVSGTVSWVQANGRRPPLCLDGTERSSVTVLMNPPFGAQDGHAHADRGFLDSAAELSTVSYSIHNAGSADFVESFAADHGGTVTHAFAVDLDLANQFAFHERSRETIDAEAFRIEWGGDRSFE